VSKKPGFKIERYHDISCGHRVVGHEGKCRHLHGHNYRIHFICESALTSETLDRLGRVIDFGVVKEKLCMWLEDNWDHHLLLWDQDSNWREISAIDPSIVLVPFNPTAENMARYLVEVIGPWQLDKTGVILCKVVVEETAKCSASYEI
jgi:6-pyruvoyltetrahydropterin/6-carboxytetrahydropterin synthase